MGDAAAPMVGRAPLLVGRESEQARVAAFVKALPDGAQALLIRGDPGIGKTTLWRDAVEGCRRGGCQVLSARPAEEEMPMALVGLDDLFDQVDLDDLAFDTEADPLASGRVVLDGLRRLAQRKPAVVAIDDVQWLDPGSARALRYALRRFDAEPVGLLLTARSGLDDPLSAEAALRPGRYEVIELGPLSLGALRPALSTTVSAISRPALRRIHEVSGGNPLYAIELARAVAGHERTPVSLDALPLPGSLQAAIAERLDSVPTELEPLLEALSGLGPTSVRALRESLADLDVDGLLALAAQRGLLTVEEDLEVRFSHPLIASVVYGRMSPLERRALHARLAGLAVDPDLKARHLALSTDEPDAEVSALLEEAAGRASGRGAPDLAAEFSRHSLRLTPPGEADSARRRALGEIENLSAAGEVGRALELADRLVASLPPGPGRADVLVERYHLENDDLELGEALLLQAVEEAGDDELLRGRVLDMLAWQRGVSRGDVHGGIACAREALSLAGRVGDLRLRMLSESSVAFLETMGGRPRSDLMARAVAREGELGGPPVPEGPRVLHAKELLWAGDLPGARASFEAALDDAVRWRVEARRPWRLYDLALVECAAGNLTAAEERVRQGLEAARDAEYAYGERLLLHPLALVAAWLGRAGEARATAGLILEAAEARGERPGIVRAQGVLGVLALSENDPATAAVELARAVRLLDEMGVAHPGAFPVLPDAVEALASSGDLTSAEALLTLLERQAAAVSSPWASAAVERCRGVLLLAQGDTEAAAGVLEAAAASLDLFGFRPDAARAVLARGRALLRAGHRTTAADVLADARRRFADVGAALWEVRAAGELERAAPGRATGAMTHTERRVAALVAQGMKNREIAQALYMSIATVEAHLTRMYRKLDIRSRSELTRLVADGSVPLDPD